MVRGVKNPTFLKLCNMLNRIDLSFTPIYNNILKEARKNEFEDSVFVIETDQNQGTAFMLENIGLVTCFHVTGDNMRIIKAYSPSECTEVTLQKSDSNKDIAILAHTSNFSCISLKKGNSEQMKSGDKIKVIGFPNYAPDATIQTYDGKVSGERLWFGHKRIVVSASIIAGNSGGPVLNDKDEVIGIAVTGRDKPEPDSYGVEYGVIPIKVIDEL
jgi:S1-C subfamily serine protease